MDSNDGAVSNLVECTAYISEQSVSGSRRLHSTEAGSPPDSPGSLLLLTVELSDLRSLWPTPLLILSSAQLSSAQLSSAHDDACRTRAINNLSFPYLHR